MKLVSYKLKGSPGSYRIGCITNNKVIDLQESYRLLLISKQENDSIRSIEHLLPTDPNAFFSLGASAIDLAKEACEYIANHTTDNLTFDREEVSFSTPVPAPSKIICVGKNYADHVAEMKGDVPEFPVLFAKFTNALIGPEDTIEKPILTEKLDYEAELVVVIGREASHVSRDNALNYIAGYSIGNDTSARDLQKRTPQWLQGKTLDRSTPVGPWVVTTEEIGNPSYLAIRSSVNGEDRQASNTSHLTFNVPFLIEFISGLITLNPGDIIFTGTPDGVGFAMDPPQFLNDGDVVTVEIDKIGELKNRVSERK